MKDLVGKQSMPRPTWIVCISLFFMGTMPELWLIKFLLVNFIFTLVWWTTSLISSKWNGLSTSGQKRMALLMLVTRGGSLLAMSASFCYWRLLSSCKPCQMTWKNLPHVSITLTMFAKHALERPSCQTTNPTLMHSRNAIFHLVLVLHQKFIVFLHMLMSSALKQVRHLVSSASRAVRAPTKTLPAAGRGTRWERHTRATAMLSLDRSWRTMPSMYRKHCLLNSNLGSSADNLSESKPRCVCPESKVVFS